MKDILKSLKDNATSRIKNPIVGAFCLAWCALNINGITFFILSNTEAKLQIVSNKTWSLYHDIGVPLIFAITYLLLLPLMNLFYEFINDGIINDVRDIQKNRYDTLKFIRKKSTVAAKIESDESYINKLKDREIDNWIEEKQTIREEFIKQKEKYSSLINKFNENEHNYLITKKQLSRDFEELKNRLKNNDLRYKDQLSYLEKSIDSIEVRLYNLELQGNDDRIMSQTREIHLLLEKIRDDFNIQKELPF